MVYEPLFPNFVFVCVSENEMTEIKKTSDVLNFIYWLGKPAVIKINEIENIARFNGMYYNIKVEKVPINPEGRIHISNYTNVPGIKVVEIKKQSIRLTLPSLGFAMLAETTDNATAEYAAKNAETMAQYY